jgi:hypothetical protein
MRIFSALFFVFLLQACASSQQGGSTAAVETVLYESQAIGSTGDVFRLRCIGRDIPTAACADSMLRANKQESRSHKLQLISMPASVKDQLIRSTAEILNNPKKPLPELNLSTLDLVLLKEMAASGSHCYSDEPIPILYSVCTSSKSRFPEYVVFYAAPVCEHCNILYPFVLKKVN